MYSLTLILLLVCTARAAHWDDKSLTQSVLMRQCLPQTHVALFDELAQFMRDTAERKVMEAVGMHALTSQLRTGHTFCRALSHVARLMVSHLEHKLAVRTTGDDMASGWRPSLAFLKHLDVAGRCEARLAGKQVPLGPLSDAVRCLTDRRKLATAQAITSRFAADEKRQ